MDVTAPVLDSADVADGGFVVELDRFRGPLDLLLHLIREQDIDIFDIPIADITEQFLKALDGIERLGIDRAGEFVEMAATLIRIKAQMLMPRRENETGEWEDPRAELVRRLLEYEHFREAADRLEDSEADRRRRYRKGHVPVRPPREDVPPPPLEITWDELWTAILAMGERRRPVPEHRVPQRSIPLEDKIALILDALTRLARVEFRRLIAPFADRLHTVVTLLGALELARRHDVAIRQGEPFGPIWLYRPNKKDANEGDADR